MKIASRLKEAQNTYEMLTTYMSAIMYLRKDNQDAFMKKHGIKMGFMSAFVKASVYALTKHPTVNLQGLRRHISCFRHTQGPGGARETLRE